jgi:hypothetical protein
VELRYATDSSFLNLLPKFLEVTIQLKNPSSLFVKRFSAVALLSLAVFLLGNEITQRAFSAAPTTKISGFSPQHASERASLKDQLKKLISTEEIRKHRYFT